MTALALRRLLQRPVSLFTRLETVLHQALQRAAERRDRHADLQALREMDERTLHDLGIGRDEIRHWIAKR